MDEQKGSSGKWTEDSILDALTDGASEHIPKKSGLLDESPGIGDEKDIFQKSILGKVLDHEEVDTRKTAARERTSAERAAKPRKQAEAETRGEPTATRGSGTASPQMFIACIGAIILIIIFFLVLRTNKYLAENEKLAEELEKRTSTHDEYEKLKLDYNALKEANDSLRDNYVELQEKYDGLEFEFEAYKGHNGQEQSGTTVSGNDEKYVVKKGETLSTISKSIYGDSRYWPNIMAANNIIDDKSIWPGMELKIPDINTD